MQEVIISDNIRKDWHDEGRGLKIIILIFFMTVRYFMPVFVFYSVTTLEPQLKQSLPVRQTFSWSVHREKVHGSRSSLSQIKPIMSASDDGRGIGWHSGNLFTKSLKALIFAWGWRANCLVNRLHCIPLPQPVQGFCLCWRSASRILTWFLSPVCFMGRSSRPASLSEHIILPLFEDGSVPSHLLFRPKWN